MSVFFTGWLVCISLTILFTITTNAKKYGPLTKANEDYR